MSDSEYSQPTGSDEVILLTRDDVMLALLEIGLGGKLVNAALVELGYALSKFPNAGVHPEKTRERL